MISTFSTFLWRGCRFISALSFTVNLNFLWPFWCPWYGGPESSKHCHLRKHIQVDKITSKWRKHFHQFANPFTAQWNSWQTQTTQSNAGTCCKCRQHKLRKLSIRPCCKIGLNYLRFILVLTFWLYYFRYYCRYLLYPSVCLISYPFCCTFCIFDACHYATFWMGFVYLHLFSTGAVRWVLRMYRGVWLIKASWKWEDIVMVLGFVLVFTV